MINAVSASTSASAAMKQATGLNKDDFLKLFVTQLQNQDPLNPMDGTEFIGQLAQLTQVEQAYNTNSNLQNILSALNGSSYMSTVSFIGKEIVASGSGIKLTEGVPVNLDYRLDGGAQQVEILIKDSSGNIVRTLSQGQAGAGDQTAVWDGRDDSGNVLSSGSYSFSVKATDASGNALTASSLVRGKVDGVNMEGSVPKLSVGGIEVQLYDILSVKGVS